MNHAYKQISQAKEEVARVEDAIGAQKLNVIMSKADQVSLEDRYSFGRVDLDAGAGIEVRITTLFDHEKSDSGKVQVVFFFYNEKGIASTISLATQLDSGEWSASFHIDDNSQGLGRKRAFAVATTLGIKSAPEPLLDGQRRTRGYKVLSSIAMLAWFSKHLAEEPLDAGDDDIPF